jgi:GTP cyclohydrolase IA
VATPMMVRDEVPSAERAVALLLRAIGEDPSREGLERTPERVAKAMAFLNSGASKTPLDVLKGAVFTESYKGMVLAQDIEFYSLCEQHLLPFHGRAHIAYLPTGRVIGLSRLPRLLDVFARRLQVQERLTDQVARAVQSAIEPRGVAVRLEAAHLCMTMRGVEKQESITMTSSSLGAFQRDMALRQQFYSALGAAPTPAPDRPREVRSEIVSLRRSASAELEPSPAPPALPTRMGVFTGESTSVSRGKYPQRVGPRPRLRGR